MGLWLEHGRNPVRGRRHRRRHRVPRIGRRSVMRALRMATASTQKFAAAALLAACCPCTGAGGAAAPAGGTEVAGSIAGSGSVTSEPYTWTSVRILGGGFVTGIIFSEAEKDLIYARTDIGGAYRWHQAGKRWVPLMDHIGPENDGGNYLGIE